MLCMQAKCPSPATPGAHFTYICRLCHFIVSVTGASYNPANLMSKKTFIGFFQFIAHKTDEKCRK